MKKIVLFSVMILMLGGCVSSKVHKELQAKYLKATSENEQLRTDKQKLEARVAELTAEMERAQTRAGKLADDTTRLGQEVRRLAGNYADLNKSYEFLLENNNSLLASNARENKALLQRLEGLQEQLQIKQDSLRIEKDRLGFLAEQLQARESRVNELESIISRKDSIVEYVRGRVANALLGFEGKGLTVEMKNGKVYVSLENSLLFPSASWTVDEKGKQALERLAVVLAENRDLQVMVEGHTDNDPFLGRTAVKDNWDLSVMRATSIVKILTSNKGVDPKRITAAGRSEYLPLASNETAQGKAKNRRTEIIITPDLGELADLIEELK